VSLRVLIIDDTVADMVAQLLPSTWEIGTAHSREELGALLQNGRCWDCALVDLRWSSSAADDLEWFDGLFAIEMLESSRLCPRILLYTEGGRSLRHHIAEASRSELFAGCIAKQVPDLSNAIERTVAGSQAPRPLWCGLRQPKEPYLVDFLLNRRGRWTELARMADAVLHGKTSWNDIAAHLYRSENPARGILGRVRENLIALDELTESARLQDFVGWVYENKAYLRSWLDRHPTNYK
jgi:hypothetical protein